MCEDIWIDRSHVMFLTIKEFRVRIWPKCSPPSILLVCRLLVLGLGLGTHYRKGVGHLPLFITSSTA